MFTSRKKNFSKKKSTLSSIQESTIPEISMPIESVKNFDVPKKIIKALYDSWGELLDVNKIHFSEGDFFHVIGRENDKHWYEVSDPLRGIRGLVPVNFFQVVERDTRPSSNSELNSGFSTLYEGQLTRSSSLQQSSPQPRQQIPQQQQQQPQPRPKPQNRQLFGIIRNDFDPERPDDVPVGAEEPDDILVYADEPVIIVARTDTGKVQVKLINRIGSSGLVHIQNIDVFDLTGEPIKDWDLNNIPSVPSLEAWMETNRQIKESSISLGTFDRKHMTAVTGSSFSASHSSTSVSNIKSNGANATTKTLLTPAAAAAAAIIQRANGSEIGSRLSQATCSTVDSGSFDTDRGRYHDFVTYASIDSYFLEKGHYWFVIYAFVNQGSSHRILYRLYEDFYDTQISLLDAFPIEAGRRGRDRTLPYMPGPLTHVDESITQERQADLNVYLDQLLDLPSYISEGELVQGKLLGLNAGDVELDYDPRFESSNTNSIASSMMDSNYGSDSNKGTGSFISSNRDSSGSGVIISDRGSGSSGVISIRKQEIANSMTFSEEGSFSIISGEDTADSGRESTSLPIHLSRYQQQPPGSNIIKVKIFHYNDMLVMKDVFIIKVPFTCSLQYLKSKVHERIGSCDVTLEYECEMLHKYVPLIDIAFIQAIHKKKLKISAVDR